MQGLRKSFLVVPHLGQYYVIGDFQ